MKHEKEIDALLEELFRSEWMTDEDYSVFLKEVFKQTGISKQTLSEQIELGEINGFGVETQLEAVRRAVKGCGEI
jgi:DNA repair exonuclease SbcCD ATPase subunit